LPVVVVDFGIMVSASIFSLPVLAKPKITPERIITPAKIIPRIILVRLDKLPQLFNYYLSLISCDSRTGVAELRSGQ